jgi:predicted MFS family arabinose efflux permease
MSGLLSGIMLARPFASFVASVAGWRWVFLTSAGLVTLVALLLAAWLPRRQPAGGGHYRMILASIGGMLARHRALRLRALYQALMFAAFNLFWTAAPLALMRDMGLSQRAVAAFALAGAGGALVAPVAGWLADHGHSRTATIGGFATVSLCFCAAAWAVPAGALIAFAITAILIDGAVQMSQVSGQRIIFALDPQARGRINAAYMTIMFVVGGMGSLIGSLADTIGGWHLAAIVGASLGGAALIALLVLEPRPART